MQKIALAVWLLVVASSAYGQNLDGWGLFKFGMSYSQAQQAIAGKGFMSHEHLAYNTEIDGQKWIVRAYFSAGYLFSVEVRQEQPRTQIGDCLGQEKRLAKMIESRYGIAPHGFDLNDQYERRQHISLPDGVNIIIQTADLGGIDLCVPSVMYEKRPALPKGQF